MTGQGGNPDHNESGNNRSQKTEYEKMRMTEDEK